ncbi:hypothetical protein BKA93DRAFT_754793 [Sparassis latifolia]
MLANLLAFLNPSRSRHDSFILLIRSSGVNCVHLVPEEPGVVEQFSAYSGSTNRLPPLSRTVTSIQSGEPLGELEVRVTEGESLPTAVQRLSDHVRGAYDAGSATVGVDKVAEIDADEARLHQCERALRQGFRAMAEEGHGNDGAGAAPVKYTVELARISRSRPGRIWDDSMLTSFPH